MPAHSLRFTTCALLIAAGLLAPRAAAQFDQFDWTLTGDPTGTGFVTADQMHVTGPDTGICSGEPVGTTWFMTSTDLPGTIDLHAVFDNQDRGSSFWHFEHAVFVRNGEQTIFNDFGGGTTSFDFEGDFSFEVEVGDTFGFGVYSVDCSFGPGVLDLTGFQFTPEAWADLGHALGGTLGLPQLVGLGTAAAGEIIKVQLDDGAPGAPATLVVGFSGLGAPFKGGVLVPDPSPPGLLLPLVVGGAGRIVLFTTLPAGFPAGLTLRLQYWIVDPVGPEGFSASNGLLLHSV
jgi:hypothetical protein